MASRHAAANARLQEVVDDYALWAPAYEPRPHNRLMEVEQEAVLALLPPLPGRRALDAGCGTGRYLRLLRELGASLVAGCDVSPDMLARGPRSRAIRADIGALPIRPGAVDVVVCGLALPDVDDLAGAIGEIAGALAPGGAMVASLLHPRGQREGWRRTFDTPDGPRERRACWHTLEELRLACARAGMTIVAIREPGLDGDRDPVALVIRADKQVTPET